MNAPDIETQDALVPFGEDNAYSLCLSPSVGLAGMATVAMLCKLTVRRVTIEPAHVEFLSDGQPSHIIAAHVAGFHAERALLRLPVELVKARYSQYINAARDFAAVCPPHIASLADHAARQLVQEHEADIRRLAIRLEDAPDRELSGDDVTVFALERGLFSKPEHVAFYFAGDKP